MHVIGSRIDKSNHIVAEASESNAMKVLRRLVTPRKDGTLVIPQEMVDKFKDIHGGGRAELLQMFERCGYNKDRSLICFIFVSLFGSPSAYPAPPLLTVQSSPISSRMRSSRPAEKRCSESTSRTCT